MPDPEDTPVNASLDFSFDPRTGLIKIPSAFSDKYSEEINYSNKYLEEPTVAYEQNINSLDALYFPTEAQYETKIPGIVDLLLVQGFDEKAMADLFAKAPVYFSKQIFDFCRQSPTLAKDLHWQFDNKELKFQLSFIERIWIYLRGFKQVSTSDRYIDLPVFDLHLPDGSGLKVDTTLEDSRSDSLSFNVNIPGFGGGTGISRMVSMTNEAMGIVESFQFHVRAALEVRELVRNDETVFCVNVKHVSGTSYCVGKSGKNYHKLSDLNIDTYYTTFGVDADQKSVGSGSSKISVEVGQSSEFSIDISSLFSSITGLIPFGEIKISSFSQTNRKILLTAHYPVGKLYNLYGASPSSLNLELRIED